MAIKLKNSRKFAAAFVLVFLFCCACGMVASYPAFPDVRELQKEDREKTQVMEKIVRVCLQGNYFLYNECTEELNLSYVMREYGDHHFFLLRRYIDCELLNFSGEALSGKNDEQTLKKLVREDTGYAFRMEFLFSEGNLESVEVTGTQISLREQFRLEQLVYDIWDDYFEPNIEFQEPENVKFIYGITEENLALYIAENNAYYEGDSSYYGSLLSNERIYLRFEFGFFLLIIAFALLVPCNKGWHIGEQRIFKAPFEVVCFVWWILSEFMNWFAEVVWSTKMHKLAEIAGQIGFQGTAPIWIEVFLNLCMWFTVFAIVYWGAVCLRPALFARKIYWRERVLCVRLWKWIFGGGRGKQSINSTTGILHRICAKGRRFLTRIYDGLIHLDLQEKTNKILLKVVFINFIFLALLSRLWLYRIFVLAVYSVVLFLFLRKYLYDIRKKYELLLQTTNRIADGNLDVPIEGDMGIFNPIKIQMLRIQEGFKKSVEEEVKSERMKTELITNVSHDLKTPLTAIITYVDLLKSEEDPKKRREYLEILEKKSQRLKLLIEDLFEISKATSKNVTMNFVEVDIAGLLKQVGLEYDNKIKEANLEFRWNLPKEKTVLLLDSQKTCRIFENLIVNITKYAMPYTRVYVTLMDLESEVTVTMKNVSATELNFDTEEITDRFVRGDASRNTEGSGLGLAIAKSFTELQYGKLMVSTDADLFKVEIRFPKRHRADEIGGVHPENEEWR